MKPGIASESARPTLAPGVRLTNSEAHGGYVLLAPERVFKLNPISAEIIRRCTGQSTLSEVIEELAGIYAAPRDLIARDVINLVSALDDKHLIALQ